ncbi:MAG: hypothetical protein H7A47_09095, partial [Verrucomicrobiales bacterium]|nr:hypothetical protein [Verrucomicrobiales bacterium]
MKSITLRADEELIEQARLVARRRHTTLSQMFRDWLLGLAPTAGRARDYRRFMSETSGEVRVGDHRFSREE